MLKLTYSNLQFQNFPGEDPRTPRFKGRGGKGALREGEAREGMGKEGKGRGGGRGGKGKYLPDQCQTASGAPAFL